MIEIPVNKPSAAGVKPSAANIERHIKRILAAFGKGQTSVFVGSGNGITGGAAKAVGKMFVDKGYFAALIHSVEGQFKGLHVSTTQMSPYSAATTAATAVPCASSASRPAPATLFEQEDPCETSCNTETWTACETEGVVEPDLFSFNGEMVTLVSSADKPYGIYRRSYPHKPKWLVAHGATHRALCACITRCQAERVVDELNALAAK